MQILLAGILKSILTEKFLKNVMCILGDYLVKSSKNKLDDKLWVQVKKVLVPGR